MKIKKILASVLSLALTVTAFNFIPVMAADITVKAENIEIEEGTTEAVIGIDLIGNPGISTIGFNVGYDSSAMTLVSYEAGEIFVTSEIYPGDFSKNPYTVSTGSAENKTNNGCLVKLKFKINENCKTGTYPVNVLDAGNIGGAVSIDDTEHNLVYVNGSITVKTKATTTTTTTTTETTTQPTTKAPTTQTTTKAEPTTQPTTKAPVTQATTKAEPTTQATTKAPVTQATTKAPVVTTEVQTESTTAAVTETGTETTTVRTSSGSSSGGSGGGRAYRKPSVATTEVTTEVTTAKTDEKVTEKATEKTTQTAKEDNISKEVRVSIDSNKVVIGDSSYTMDAAPYIQPESNSTLVPLRFAVIAISGESIENADTSSIISWDADTKTAVIKAKGKTISFTAGSSAMIIDGKSVPMENDVKSEIKESRMYIPFRALGNALGVKVDWDADTKTAIFRA